MPDALLPGCDENLEVDPDVTDPQVVRAYTARVRFVPTWRDKLRSFVQKLASRFNARKTECDKPTASFEDALKRIPDADLRRYVKKVGSAPECRSPEPLRKMLEVTRRLHWPKK